MELESSLQMAAAVAAMAALGQVVTRRLPIPLPVFLLAAGMLLGREGLRIVDPAEVPQVARLAVVLAVAFIVFEGGLSLNWRFLGVVASPVRNLVILGLIITPIVGALSAHYFLDFGWRMAFLFGALVSVTGPSVISPLLRSVRVNDQLRATLMGEGIIIDPLGALLTLFLLQVALTESLDPTGPAAWVAERITIGVVVGLVGAAVTWGALRLVERLSGREVGLLVIGATAVAFALAESLAHEAGLTAMVVMAVALANAHVPHRESLDELLETFSALLVGTVYVLLAASVDLGALRDLWPEGAFVVLALILVGRPLLALLATAGSTLSWRERIFLSAVAPRGVVAASLASVVAVEASESLGTDEQTLVALVFAVILGTITIQSAYAGPLSRLLRVYPMRTVIAGAGDVGIRLAAKLTAAGEQVTLIETDDEAAVRAREDGLDVVVGDIGEIETLQRAGLADAQAFIVTTPNDDRNLLAAQLARAELKCERIFARVNNPSYAAAFSDLGVVVVNPAAATASELAAALGDPDLQRILPSVSGDVTATRFTVSNPSAQRQLQSLSALRGTVVPLIRRGSRNLVPDGRTAIELGDVVTVFGRAADVARARRALTLDAD